MCIRLAQFFSVSSRETGELVLFCTMFSGPMLTVIEWLGIDTVRRIEDFALRLFQLSIPTVSPASPTRFGNAVVSAVSALKFPLHFALDNLGRQFEMQFFEKDLLVISRF